MKWIPVVDGLPESPGRYIVSTVSSFQGPFGKVETKHRLEANFNGKTFDVNNQVVVMWLYEG